MVERLIPRKIYKTKVQQWHHPAYFIEGKAGQLLRLEIARLAAAEGLVPLYELFGLPERKGLHSTVLNLLAEKRIQELEAEVRDGTRTHESILAAVEPDLERLRKGDSKAITDAWARLRAEWVTDVANFLESTVNNSVPSILLPSAEINRAVAIFETMNRGGTPLDVYDLVVARAARTKTTNLTEMLRAKLEDEIELPTAVSGGRSGIFWSAAAMGTVEATSLSKTFKNAFLDVLSVFAHVKHSTNPDTLRVEHIKKTKILKLSTDQINGLADRAATAVIRALAFLQMRCGVVKDVDLQYKLMLVPLAWVFDDDWEDPQRLNFAEAWYWSSLFGGEYRERQNERCIDDIEALRKLVDDGNKSVLERSKTRILSVPEYSDESTLMMDSQEVSIPKAIDSAILQYVLSERPKDFLKEDMELSSFDFAKGDLLLEDHHIVPLGTATTITESSKKIRGDRAHILNSPLNRTLISRESNQKIRSRRPEEYFEAIKEPALYSHLLPGKTAEVKQKDGEPMEDYHRRVLSGRYKELRRMVIQEVEKLLNTA